MRQCCSCWYSQACKIISCALSSSWRGYKSNCCEASVKTVEGTSVCSYAGSISLSALTNGSEDPISELIPWMAFYSLRDIFESEMDLRKTLTAYMSPAVKLTSCSLQASQAEPKPFSKSSMKSAPLAQQRGANEANGRITDTLILWD